ncbi:MAG: hypothetical protein ACRDDF_01525, partial [Aeromonas sp.]
IRTHAMRDIALVSYAGPKLAPSTRDPHNVHIVQARYTQQRDKLQATMQRNNRIRMSSSTALVVTISDGQMLSELDGDVG